MRMRGVCVMVIMMLVSSASSDPRCRPATACYALNITGANSNYFQFNVTGSTTHKGLEDIVTGDALRVIYCTKKSAVFCGEWDVKCMDNRDVKMSDKEQRFIIEYEEKSNNIFLSCNSKIKDITYYLSIDDPALPTMSPPVTVSKVEIKGCTVPNNGSYYEALKGLNITFSSDGNGILWLTELPSEPQLEEHHMDGLLIEDLLITANYSHKPTCPKFNFLNKLQYLKTLELKKYVVLQKEAIEHLPEALEKLTLRSTQLPTAENELGNGTFWLERLRSLRYLFLWEDRAGWATRTLLLPPLASLPYLTSVTIQNVLLPPIPNNKQWLKDSKLQILELHSCGLTELPPDLFTGANLTKLTLNNNNLVSLPEGIFSPLKSLTELNMSDNKLDGKTLQLALKPLADQLKILRVKNNPLGSLCGDRGRVKGIQVSNLPKSLRWLDLNKTGASRICSDWIQNDGLMYINLDGNNISTLSYTDLMMKRREVNAPIRIMLNYNPLRKIKVTKEDFNQCLNARSSNDRETHKRARVELRLKTLACECEDAYWLSEILRSCSLLRMTIVSCDPNPPAGAPRTLQDYLPDRITCGYDGPCPKGCDCWKRPFDNATVVRCGTLEREPQWPPAAPGWPLALHVAPGTLTAVPSVTLVELHAPNNNIRRINDIPNTLRVLDVRNNSIAHISAAAADSLFRRRTDRGYRVSVAGNTLACACEDEPAISKLKLASIIDWNITRCLDGNYVIGKTMADLCKDKILLPLLVTLSAMFILLLVTVIIRFKLPKIRQFLFDHNMCLKWVLGVKDDVDDPMKTHDVFISYSYNDYQYAKRLIEKLEERGHSTIEHCRDWLPGKPVSQQITHSVMSARRTLLLVSDNYANSKWGLEEFHAAHGHAMEHGSARVIVIRCKLLAPQDLPPELQLYLYNNTYLDWSDRYFWNKLWRVMPTPRAVPTPAIALLHSQDVPPSVTIQVALESTTVRALQLSGDKDLPLSELVLVPPTPASVPLSEHGQNQPPAPPSPVTPVARIPPPPPISDKNTPLSRRIRQDSLDTHVVPITVSPCAC